MPNRHVANEPATVVRRMFAAREHGDIGQMLALMDRDVSAAALADGQRFEGIDSVRAWLADERRGGPRTEVEALAVEAMGDDVLVTGRMRAFGAIGMRDSPACWLCHVRDGLVTRIRGYRTPAEARAALNGAATEH